MEAAEREPLIFDDVAVYFTPEEWRSLEEWQQELYKEVMMDNYHTLRSLGIPMVKSELLLLIEGGQEPCVQGHPRWEELGSDPHLLPDPQGCGDAEAGAVYQRVWTERRPLAYRRVVRKRCGRRSPNFSRVELESFVSLMDRYLPDELQRAGAISLRQRRSILQEIARRLEPMSGCLRTPRQLLHRWADFNNRDPERLMDIRMQLHYAASGDQRWDPSEVQPPSSRDKRWSLSAPHPLSSSSSSCSSESEEEAQDPFDAVWDEGPRNSSTQYLPVSTDPPPKTLYTIDAQGRYIVTPPPPNSGDRSMALDPKKCAGDTNPGLRTIKSEPDCEEDEGGGSWSSDPSSPASVMSSKIHRSKVSDGQSPEQLSPEDSYTMRASPAGDTPEARSLKRSPNFSPAELECFVALMDHFLPDNLIRAGALPIRQRKAILQEIARRLEPLSGCLRTPRQLRHRWTDFNNRDPDRLEEIRRRLRRAGRQASCKKPGGVLERTPATGNWRRRHSRPLRQDIKEERTTEQIRPDPSEEHLPTITWHPLGLPKTRNSFSVARLKKKHHLAFDILRVEKLLRRVDQRQEVLLHRDNFSADEDD